MALAWLCFLPNAPYLVTDLVHLPSVRDGRFWVDLVLTLLFALTGLLLGFVSLQLMHRLVAHRWGVLVGWLFSATAAGLAGIGVCLGRFLRWNSWDVVRHPIALLTDVSGWLWNAAAHRSGLKLPLLFAAFLFLGYVMLHAITQWNAGSSGRVDETGRLL